MYCIHQFKRNCVDGTSVKIHVFVAKSPQSNNHNRKFWTVSKAQVLLQRHPFQIRQHTIYQCMLLCP